MRKYESNSSVRGGIRCYGCVWEGIDDTVVYGEAFDDTVVYGEAFCDAVVYGRYHMLLLCEGDIP